MDKHTEMSNLKNLKAYNSKKQVNFNNEHFYADSSHRKAQYSSLITCQRNSMKERSLCRFKSACKSRKKTRWAIHNEEYCLFMDDKLVTM